LLTSTRCYVDTTVVAPNDWSSVRSRSIRYADRRRYGRDVTLTPESSLCSIPDGEDNEPLAKSEILHAVWGSGFDGDPNIVEVYMATFAARLTSLRSSR